MHSILNINVVWLKKSDALLVNFIDLEGDAYYNIDWG